LANEAGGWGGALYCNGSITLEESVFFRNKADQGAAVMAYCADRVAHSTFLLNEVRGGAGATLEAFGDCWPNPISHCIVARTINGYGVECNYAKNLECCDVWGNEAGDYQGMWCWNAEWDGNFSADPRLCDEVNEDVRLREGSPCLPGQHGPVTCGLIGAMGPGCEGVLTGACCFLDASCVVLNQSDCENQQGTYMGAGEVCDPNPCVSGVEDAAQAASLKLTTTPNPSTGQVMIRYALPKATMVTIEVFDAGGGLVRRFDEGRRPAGAFSVSWDGRDDNGRDLPTGVYFARIVTGQGSAMGRAVIAR
jgi:predicted outer membrane repeat protein